MIRGNAKRVLVIKDIPSNIIEEAIFVLKSEPGVKDSHKNTKENFRKKNESDFLLKEAELIINNYIRENKNGMGSTPGKAVKLKPDKKRVYTNTFINLAMIGSIALLVFVISKMF